MMDLQIDTTKTVNSGQDIMKLSQDYLSNLELLYDRISQMPEKTLEWVGTGAEKFVRQLNEEKKTYIELGNIITSYGKNLINAADSIERIFSNNIL